MACTVLVLATVAVWLLVHAARRMTVPPPSVLFVGFAAAVCTAYSADTSWRYAEHELGMTNTAERAVMYAAAEIALLACTVMARANVRSGTTEDRIGSPGLPGTLVWVNTGVQVIPAFSESGFWGGLVRAVFGPVLAGLLWHQVMGLQVRVARPRALSS
ncbi:hypothetical protein QC029_30500, partial [Streptomyces sp. DH37]|nr:hypothetical protein [Streptomyces sp. DH37]